MNPSLEQLSEQFTQLVGTGAPAAEPVVAGLAEAGPGSATPATPAAPPPPPPPVQATDFALKGYHLDVRVAPDQVVAAAEIVDRAGFGIDAVTGVDWIAQDEMEVVYDYFHPTSPLRR